MSYSKHSKCVFLAGAEDIKKKKKRRQNCTVKWLDLQFKRFLWC